MRNLILVQRTLFFVVEHFCLFSCWLLVFLAAPPDCRLSASHLDDFHSGETWPAGMRTCLAASGLSGPREAVE